MINKVLNSQIGYIFSFAETDYKLTIFANCYLQARQYLSAHPHLYDKTVIDMCCFTPITGMTKRKVLNGTFLWVGVESPDGWRRIE